MNCCIQRNRHKKSPHQRIRIGVVHVVSWFVTNFLSQVRVHFLKMWNISNRYLEIVWPLWVDVDDVCAFSCKIHRTRWKVQVLVRFCSSRSLHPYVRFYIWVPHLRTRRCVILIWIFSCRLPCTSFQTQALTGCSEYRRQFDALELCAVEELATVSKPGSSSFLTLPYLFLLLLLPVSFSTLPGGCWQSWNCWCWTNGEDGSTHHVWNWLLSVCLRVGTWCQRIGFGCFGPDWFCQMTIQAQLCGFGKHVSLSDFCLWWSSWSPLHDLQKCKAWRQNDKISRLRKHNRHWPTQDRCVELKSWFGCWCVCLMVCYAAGFSAHALGLPVLDWVKNATLQSRQPRAREREFHPCVNLHQGK